MEYGEVSFRKGVKTDVEAVVELLKERCRWMDRKGIQQWNNEGYLSFYNHNYFSSKADNGELYVAEIGEKIVGMFVLLENDKRWDDDISAYYLHNFTTDPEIRGLGEIILKYCEKKAVQDGKERFRLDCGVKSKELNDYYESRGFVFVGVCDESPYYKGNKREKKLS